MARSSRRRRRDRMIEEQRDTSVIPRHVLPAVPSVALPSLDDLLDLVSVEDTRQWSPTVDTAKVIDGTPARVVRQVRGKSWRSGDVFGFRDAGMYVVRCIRRKERREVLFARKRTGKGSANPKRLRNLYSSVRC